jgi:hypothetical protein
MEVSGQITSRLLYLQKERTLVLTGQETLQGQAELVRMLWQRQKSLAPARNRTLISQPSSPSSLRCPLCCVKIFLSALTVHRMISHPTATKECISGGYQLRRNLLASTASWPGFGHYIPWDNFSVLQQTRNCKVMAHTNVNSLLSSGSSLVLGWVHLCISLIKVSTQDATSPQRSSCGILESDGSAQLFHFNSTFLKLSIP